jgi:hypothetical protein
MWLETNILYYSAVIAFQFDKLIDLGVDCVE